MSEHASRERRTSKCGRASSRSREGLTLIEVMMALMILGIGLSVLISTASRCLAVVKQSRSYETARNLLGRVELEEPLQLKEKIEPGSEGGSFRDDYNGYRWSRDIEVVGNEDDGLFKVTSRVYWSDRGGESIDEVVTYLYFPEEKKGGSVVSPR